MNIKDNYNIFMFIKRLWIVNKLKLKICWQSHILCEYFTSNIQTLYLDKIIYNWIKTNKKSYKNDQLAATLTTFINKSTIRIVKSTASNDKSTYSIDKKWSYLAGLCAILFFISWVATSQMLGDAYPDFARLNAWRFVIQASLSLMILLVSGRLSDDSAFIPISGSDTCYFFISSLAYSSMVFNGYFASDDAPTLANHTYAVFAITYVIVTLSVALYRKQTDWNISGIMAGRARYLTTAHPCH